MAAQFFDDLEQFFVIEVEDDIAIHAAVMLAAVGLFGFAAIIVSLRRTERKLGFLVTLIYLLGLAAFATGLFFIYQFQLDNNIDPFDFDDPHILVAFVAIAFLGAFLLFGLLCRPNPENKGCCAAYLIGLLELGLLVTLVASLVSGNDSAQDIFGPVDAVDILSFIFIGVSASLLVLVGVIRVFRPPKQVLKGVNSFGSGYGQQNPNMGGMQMPNMMPMDYGMGMGQPQEMQMPYAMEQKPTGQPMPSQKQNFFERASMFVGFRNVDGFGGNRSDYDNQGGNVFQRASRAFFGGMPSRNGSAYDNQPSQMRNDNMMGGSNNNMMGPGSQVEMMTPPMNNGMAQMRGPEQQGFNSPGPFKKKTFFDRVSTALTNSRGIPYPKAPPRGGFMQAISARFGRSEPNPNTQQQQANYPKPSFFGRLSANLPSFSGNGIPNRPNLFQRVSGFTSFNRGKQGQMGGPMQGSPMQQQPPAMYGNDMGGPMQGRPMQQQSPSMYGSDMGGPMQGNPMQQQAPSMYGSDMGGSPIQQAPSLYGASDMGSSDSAYSRSSPEYGQSSYNPSHRMEPRRDDRRGGERRGGERRGGERRGGERRGGERRGGERRDREPRRDRRKEGRRDQRHGGRSDYSDPDRRYRNDRDRRGPRRGTVGEDGIIV